MKINRAILVSCFLSLVSADSFAQTIAGGQWHSLTLCSDSTVMAWGQNNVGQLGNGTNTVSYIPVQLSSLSGISAIGAGSSHSLALKNDGTARTWGYNDYGQLGNGNNTDSNVPVQVNSLSGIAAIGAGFLHSLARKNDGTLWVWGYNNYGQLGNGSTINSNVPLQVTGLCQLPTGVEEENTFSFVVIFPNPATSEVSLINSKLNVQNVEVYDVHGQLQTSKFNFQSNSIDVSGLQSGLYFIMITTPNKVISKKFVKQ